MDIIPKTDLMKIFYWNSPFGVWIINRNFFVEMNDSGVRIMNCGPKENIIGKNPGFFAPTIQPDGKNSMEKIKEVFTQDLTSPLHFDFVQLDKENNYVYLDVTIFVLDEERDLLIGFFKDTTKEKYLERRNILIEKDFDRLLMSLDSFVSVRDLNGTLIKANSQFQDYVDADLKDLVGTNITDWFSSETSKRIRELDNEQYNNNASKSLTMKYVTSKGKEKWVSSTRYLMNTEDNNLHIVSIDTDITSTVKAKENYKNLFYSITDTIVSITELNDFYTAGHQRKTSEICKVIAKNMGLQESNIEKLVVAALLHDIGKIDVPNEMLNKPSKLHDFELDMIQEHVQSSYEIVRKMPFETNIAEIIYQHHENVDGSGYPNNLVESEITLEAQIIRVADSIEAMSNHRPFRTKKTNDEIIIELQSNIGKLYSKKVVNTAVKLLKKGIILVN